MNISIGGIDLTNNPFQVCVLSFDGPIARNRKVSRVERSDVLKGLPEAAPIAIWSSPHFDRTVLS